MQLVQGSIQDDQIILFIGCHCWWNLGPTAWVFRKTVEIHAETKTQVLIRDVGRYLGRRFSSLGQNEAIVLFVLGARTQILKGTWVLENSPLLVQVDTYDQRPFITQTLFKERREIWCFGARPDVENSYLIRHMFSESFLDHPPELREDARVDIAKPIGNISRRCCG